MVGSVRLRKPAFLYYDLSLTGTGFALDRAGMAHATRDFDLTRGAARHAEAVLTLEPAVSVAGGAWTEFRHFVVLFGRSS
jgi:hypothetical protein